MKAVLLPGLDGTGALHEAFVAALGMPCDVISYPPDVFDYADLEGLVAGQMPSDDFILIAESFSGPLAIALAAAAPPNLRAVVFVASFAHAPRPAPRALASLLSFAPMKSRFACQIMQPAVMGRWASSAFTWRLWKALKTVPAKTMARRLEQVLAVDRRPLLAHLTVPMMYMQARSDRLVPKRAAAPFAEAGAAISVQEGPHFLLQAVPDDAAKTIRDFVTGLGVEAPPSPG